MKAILEGLLFVSGDSGLTIKEIMDILEIDLESAKEIIKELYNDYLNTDRGIKLEFLGGHFKLTTKNEHKEYYQKLVSIEQNTKLSQSALEVLSIIAYNQPITRINIDKIRGVNSSYIVRKLVLNNLIEDCGKSEDVGRPLLYKVTDHFLNYFGLGSIKDLPKIEVIDNNDNKDDISIFDTKYTDN